MLLRRRRRRLCCCRNFARSYNPALHNTDTDTDILAMILADTSDTRSFLKLFLWQAERHADVLATILARMSARMSVSVSVLASGMRAIRHADLAVGSTCSMVFLITL